jgi:extracellular factor (EF) 3-hydroxypalmitic acid methyl ester biosynthesis protein
MDLKIDTNSNDVKLSWISCRTEQGSEVRGALVRFNRFSAVFEVGAPAVLFRASEVLAEFKIVLNDQTAYSGKAVVTNLVVMGEVLVCEVSLEDAGIVQPPGSDHFAEFLREWQKSYKIAPDFKLVVADMRSLFADLRLWANQLELNIRSHPNAERGEMEQVAAEKIAPEALATIDSLGDRFEEISARLEPELRPAHIHFTRRNLHSFLLCSPFAYRTFYKPLGYAGDYEMVNMILKSPFQGSSLFAKIINAWFLNQLPAQAHRNRIVHLKQRLIEETMRARRLGRTAKIFNLGCGPSTEILNFMADSPLADYAEFTLLDFNEETIQHATGVLQKTREQHGRRTGFQIRKKSVQQVLKEAAKPSAGSAGKYDFVYCAGLFDYLPDRVCKQLTDVFYSWLAPGGLELVTNVDGTRPFRNKLEFILDWNLIYRSGAEMNCLLPDGASPEHATVQADLTSVNLFLEVRKPDA